MTHLVGRSKYLGQGETAGGRAKSFVELRREAGAAQASVANISRAAEASSLPLKNYD